MMGITPEAFNFNVNANVDDGTCEEVVIGCTDDTALNYNETANTNSGVVIPLLTFFLFFNCIFIIFSL